MRVFRNNWFMFYPKFGDFYFMYNVASYFDRRPCIHLFVTQILSLILFPFLGMHWYSISLLVLFCISWGEMYIHLPFDSGYDECDPPRYGIYYHACSVVICRGVKLKFLHMPYQYDWVRTSILLKTGEWEHETKKKKESFYEDKWTKLKWLEEHPYTYVLKSGKVQQRIATITVEEREWRKRWLKWTSLFNKVRKDIAVEFSYGGPISRNIMFEKTSHKERKKEETAEVGERTGDWKGGTIGYGYNMLPGEAPIDTLRRMERERIFN